jgi:hypothetical protein
LELIPALAVDYVVAEVISLSSFTHLAEW